MLLRDPHDTGQEKGRGTDVLHESRDQPNRAGEHTLQTSFFLARNPEYGGSESGHDPATVDPVTEDHHGDDRHDGVTRQAGQGFQRLDEPQPWQGDYDEEGDYIDPQLLGHEQNDRDRKYSEDQKDFRRHGK